MTDDLLRVLVVRPPWANCIFAPARPPWIGPKTVENRGGWRSSYTGLVAIQVGKAWFPGAEDDYRVKTLLEGRDLGGRAHNGWSQGHIIGVVTIANVHRATHASCDCPERSCWAEREYIDSGGQLRTDVSHLVLEHPIAIAQPVKHTGQLGLHTLDPWDTDKVMTQYHELNQGPI